MLAYGRQIEGNREASRPWTRLKPGSKAERLAKIFSAGKSSVPEIWLP